MEYTAEITLQAKRRLTEPALVAIAKLGGHNDGSCNRFWKVKRGNDRVVPYAIVGWVVIQVTDTASGAF